MTALSEARLDALDEFWAEMGRECYTHAVADIPDCALPWPRLRPGPDTSIEETEVAEETIVTTFG